MSDAHHARAAAPDIGLPSAIRACLFDLDGVLTDTASVHAEAWKAMFDAFLAERARSEGTRFVEFDAVRDYRAFIDGKQRYDGVRAFLTARGIELSEGLPTDAPDAETVAGLGNRKNELVLDMMQHRGVHAYDGSVRFVQAARAAGFRQAVVSASANCKQVLDAAGLGGLFDARVDGIVAAQEDLRGKPAPDMFLAAARILRVPPREAAVFEDALAGVAAGRSGRFGFVVGVDRAHQEDALRSHGADIVISDLAELLRPR